jgi:predicted Zn-dependent protease
VGDAIRYLVAQPAAAGNNPQNSSKDPIAQASQFAVNWSKKDPEAASQWVQTLPSGDAKLWAQKNLAANWSQYNPEAVDQWIKTLPAASRGEVEKFIKHDSKVEEPEPEG